MLKIYTRRPATTGRPGLLYGGRVAKDAPSCRSPGRSTRPRRRWAWPGPRPTPGSELDELLTRLERELYVLMAEVTTDPAHRSKLVAGTTLVTDEMVAALEAQIDDLIARVSMPTEFVIPGANRASAALDLARTVVRRAERLLVSSPIEGSLVGRYLNRLSDLLWALARWTEGERPPPGPRCPDAGGRRRRRRRTTAGAGPDATRPTAARPTTAT